MSEDRVVIVPNKLSKVVKREGTGEQAKTGDKVYVHYVGTLESNGEKFDSSRDRNEPFEFTIGQGVIEGWSVGVATMKVGELSVFTISSEMGYGKSGSPPKIPGGATLVFEIELLGIHKEMTNEEALTEVTKLNELGGNAFKSGDMNLAIQYYHDGIHVIHEKHGEQFDSFRVRLNNNVAVAHSKLGHWGEVLSHSSQALETEKDNTKALFKKAEAEIKLGKFEDAKKDVTRGLELTKNDASFLSLKKQIQDAEKEAQKTQDGLFAKMFKK